jgi:protein sidekick
MLIAEKPAFLTDLKRVTLIEYGTTATLACDVAGVPPPSIQWFRNAEAVDKLLGTR